MAIGSSAAFLSGAIDAPAENPASAVHASDVDRFDRSLAKRPLTVHPGTFRFFLF
jgi:hypothetical protein